MEPPADGGSGRSRACGESPEGEPSSALGRGHDLGVASWPATPVRGLRSCGVSWPRAMAAPARVAVLRGHVRHFRPFCRSRYRQPCRFGNGPASHKGQVKRITSDWSLTGTSARRTGRFRGKRTIPGSCDGARRDKVYSWAMGDGVQGSVRRARGYCQPELNTYEGVFLISLRRIVFGVGRNSTQIITES